jgi:DNA mismatch repair protein MutL
MGDASLHFPSAEQLRFFVNERPVEDKIMKKAVMQLMKRQLPAGLFPFVYLFVQIDPTLVDVNVHPRKIEVRFLDPGAIFSGVTTVLQRHLGDRKSVICCICSSTRED